MIGSPLFCHIRSHCPPKETLVEAWCSLVGIAKFYLGSHLVLCHHGPRLPVTQLWFLLPDFLPPLAGHPAKSHQHLSFISSHMVVASLPGA